MIQPHPKTMLEEYKLDDIDFQVLRVYQRDASLSYKELGEIANLPPSTVFDRIKRLRRLDIIRTIIPMLDTEKLGLVTTAWLQVTLGPVRDCCKTADEIAKIPEVLEVHEIAGAVDLLVKVKVRDNLDLHNMSEIIGHIPGVQSAASIIAIRTVKEDIRPNF
jgi:Lrp/AsnC family leucine-responsive transcriptional regulator